MNSSHDLKVRRAGIAREVRGARPEVADRLRRDYREAALADAIRATVEKMPPLSSEQKAKLAVLLLGSETVGAVA